MKETRNIGLKYLQFLRYAVDAQGQEPDQLDDMDWQRLMAFAERQSVIGVVYDGIQRLRQRVRIPKLQLVRWVGNASQVEARNILLNELCVEVCDAFRKEGFECCLLKGQGNALMYPKPLLRTSGDIDVWVRSVNKEVGKNHEVRNILHWVRKRNPQGKTEYHHIDYGMYKDVDVEVHYRPTFMNNLINNGRLQRWMNEHKEEQFSHWVSLPKGEGRICVPTWEFNVVFQLSHMYRHVLQSGLGFKNLIDFYFLLVKSEQMEARCLERDLRYLGLSQFASAVMWVLREVLGLEERYLLVPADERRGRFLLKEVVSGGNFGKYNQRNAHQGGQIQANVNRLMRDVRLVRYFPSECIWEPIFRIWHFCWRVAH